MGDYVAGAKEYGRIVGDTLTGKDDPLGTGGANGTGNPLAGVDVLDPLTPASTKNIDQSMADSRALMQMFMAQQGQLAAVPGLTGPGYDQPAGAAAPAATPAPAAPATPAGAPDPAGIATPATQMASALAAATPASTQAPVGGRPAPAPIATPVGSNPTGSQAGLAPRILSAAPSAGLVSKGGAAAALSAAGGAPPPAVSAGAQPLISRATPSAPEPTGAPTAAPLAPGLDQTQSNQFRQGQLALAQSIGQSLGAEQPGAVTLDEQRLLDARGRQMGLATQLAEAAGAGPSAVPLLNEAAQLEARGKQNATIDMIRAAAEGKVPSVAEMQGMRQMGTLQSNILGNAAAAGRGGNTALALRSAIQATGRAGGDAIANAAMQRAAETAGARGQLAGAIEAQRATDVGVAGQNQQAELASRNLDTQRMSTAASGAANILGNVSATDLNAARANQDAAVTNRSQNIQETTAARGQLADVMNQGRGTDVNIAAQNQDSQITTRGQNIQQTQGQAQNVLDANRNQATAAGAQFAAETAQKQQTGNLIATAANVLSDERLKDDIVPVPSGAFREFLAAIEPSSFRYKGSSRPEVGVMAQDVEKSRVGKTLVRETPAGKAIDIPRTATAMLAALSDVNRRVSRLEGGA